MTTTTTEQIPTTTWDAIAEDLLQSRHIKLLGSSVSRILLNSPAVNLSSGAATASNSPSTRAQWTSAVWQHILDSDLHGLTVAGLLPMNLGSQPAAVLKEAVVVQIQTSRDATQPLRVCADTDDADVANLAAAQRSTSTRLLKLTLTDGHVEVPAIELQTLRCFRGIPTPGEKLLLAAGTEIKNGMVLLTDAHVVCLGGSERRLRDEFQMQSNHRGMRWTFANGGAEGAPKFTPLHQLTGMNCGSSSGGNGGGGGSAGGARGGRGHAGREADTHPPTGGRGGRGAAKEAHHPQQQNHTSGPPPSLPHSLSGSAGPSSPPPHDRAPYRERGRGGGAERGGGGRGGERGGSTRDGRGAGRGGRGERGGGRGGGRGRGQFADPYSSPPNASSHHRPMETTTGSSAAKPVGMPKFSDADFPELGGDW